MNDLLSPLEAVMWRVGQDPGLRMVVADLIVLERPISTTDLVSRLRLAADGTSRLKEWPGDPTYVRRRPHWVSESAFDPVRHVRSLTLPSPGQLRELLEVLAILEATPFEPGRPPWDATVIGGLDGGRSAVLLRAHHVLTDGLGATPILNLLVDERHSPGRESTDTATATPVPSPQTDGLRNGVITIDLRRAIRPLGSGLIAASEPTVSLARGLQTTLDVANSVSRQILVTGGPLGPWPHQRSTTSHFMVMSVPGARDAALSLGGSRNDLLVAAAASGIGLYLELQGEPCPTLRLATPTSARHNTEFAGNWFAPVRIEVPTSDTHPGPMFGVIAERLAQARKEPAARLTTGLAAAIGRLPNRLLIPAMQAQADTVDFAATTLPGPRKQANLCRAPIAASFPFGPRLGCPINVTAFGNEDRLDIGIAVDSARVVDPERLLECITTAFCRFVPGFQTDHHILSAD